MLKRVVVVAMIVAAIGSPERLALHGYHVARGVQPSGPADRTIRYRFSFPEPQHHWMQADVVFPQVGSGVLELRMSRSSPGRYSLHDFAKNVYDVRAFGADGRELRPARPDPDGWNVAGHGGAVTVKYKVYGDRVDGTYLAVDATHAHVNMPAAIMWAHGLDDRPATISFDQPAGMRWQVATQLHPQPNDERRTPNDGRLGFVFSAPNLQYLMDSPAEFGPISTREFAVGSSRFRFSLHHTGTDAELDGFVKDVEKIVKQERAIFSELPDYEPGYYTFLADYLPYADGDGMEHRNSTVITSSTSIARDSRRLLDTVAHEFFHCWNVERVRPKGLEPFDFDRANLSDSLWLAEGFTEYYGPIALRRAGLADMAATAGSFGGLIESVAGPGRLVRSAAEMSEMAPFIDGERAIDRTNFSNTVISYYPFGGAIALALDLTLRERSDSRVSLDDFMQAMWRTYGKPGGGRQGYVDHPYTIADAEATLADVSGDRAFARDFFSRYVQGHDVADYATLLARAGLTVRKRNPGRAWLGDLRLASRNATRVASLAAPTWPIYATGIDQDDDLQQVDGQKIGGESDLAAAVQRHKPGDRLQIVFVDRTGAPKTASVTLAEDPHVDVVPADTGSLTAAQKMFRDRWLGPK